MARELIITIRVDGSQAKAELSDVEKGAEKIATTADTMSTKVKTALGVPEHGGLLDWVENLGHSFVARVAEGVLLRDAVREMINLGKEAFTDASKFENLSHATGLSVQAIQQFSYVGDEFGVTVDEMARGVEQLSIRLAGHDPSATSAVAGLGLSLNTLLAAGPEEMFLQIAEAVGHIEDPTTKARVAAELFGSRLSAILLPALGELRTKLEDASHTTAMMSNETVDAAHSFEVAWSHALMTAKAWIAEGVVGFKHMGDAIASAGIADELGTVAMALDTTTEATVKLVASHDSHAAAQAHVITNAEMLANRLEALRNQAIVPLNETQKAAIVELDGYGESQKSIAELIGTTEIAVHRYIQAVHDAAAADKAAGEAAIKAANDAARAQTEAFATEERQLSEIVKARTEHAKAVTALSHDTLAVHVTDAYLAADAEIAALQKSKAYTIAAEAEIRAAANQTAQNIMTNFLEADEHSRAHFDKLADEARIAYQFAMQHADQYSADWIQKLRETADAAQRAAEQWGLSFDTALEHIDQKSTAVANKMTLTWSEAMDAVQHHLGTMTGSVQAQTLAQLRAAAAAAGGSVNWDDYNNPYIYIPGANAPGKTAPRAMGGPVESGSPYLVGERGPEIFVPKNAGQIVPNSGMHPSVTVNIDARESFFDSSAGVQRLADKVARALTTQRLSYGSGLP